MTSPQATKNTRNSALVYAEASRYIPLRSAGADLPYFGNLAIAQDALEGWHQQGHRNKPMNGNVAVCGRSPEVDGQVTPISEARDQESPSEWAMTPTLASTDTLSAADVTEVADFVDVMELGEVYRSPFLRDFGIHVTGLPSGAIGLEIKNPSRAATLGGFAIDSTSALRSQEIGG